MSGNNAWNRNVLNGDRRLTETGQRDVVRQAVADGGKAGDWKGPAADTGQFNRLKHRVQQTDQLSLATAGVA